MNSSQVNREAIQEIYPVNVPRKGKETRLWQVWRYLVARKSKEARRWQVWHYLIPVFITFWIIFGIVLITSDFLFLAISALAVIALFSILIIALAWAYQNNI